MSERPLLRMEAVRRRFGATVALDGVSLQLARGEVLALIGENGAGKSTLMKVLSGVHAPDAGSLWLGDRPYAPTDPADARRSGVVMIYQELTLAGELSVVDNILLGRERARCGIIARRASRRLAAEALERMGIGDLDLDAPVRGLSLARQQMIEIARALIGTPRVLVLDEPTSSLTRGDAERLFSVVRRLRNQGVAVIYISHFLEECQQIADRFVVLRDGRNVAEGPMAGVGEAALIRHMVGREISDLYPRHGSERGAALLQVRDLRSEALPHGIDLEVHAGQVLGIFGLMGSGRTELLRAIVGLDPARGTVLVDGVPGPWDPGRCWAHGLGLVSEDRKGEGLLLGMDIADNLTLPHLAPYRQGPVLLHAGQRRGSAPWIRDLGIACAGPGQTVGELSGGNQQKVAVARLAHAGCRVLLLDEPTRGIDVAAKARIYRLIADLAEDGRAVLMVSSYLPELLGICDSIAVMCRGRLGATRTTAEWSEQDLLGSAIGAPVEASA